MKEQFVTYEIALKLKELGFDQPCLAYFKINYDAITQKHSGNLILGVNPEYLTCQKKMHYIFGQQICLAPLWQQAIQFIEDNFDLQIEFVSHGFPAIYKHVLVDHDYVINESQDIPISRNNYELYNQAILKAIELINKT